MAAILVGLHPRTVCLLLLTVCTFCVYVIRCGWYVRWCVCVCSVCRCGRWCVHVYTLEHACILVSFPTRALRLPLNYRNAEMKNAWEGSAMPRSVLTLECCHVLMRERTSVQPISVQVRLMTGSKHTVEHRNFE